MIPDGPLLWYVNRSTGLVLLALLTATVAPRRAGPPAATPGPGCPVRRRRSLHRNIGLLSLLLLVIHVVTAVLDEFVDIRWWQAFVPADLHYEPVWLAPASSRRT